MSKKKTVDAQKTETYALEYKERPETNLVTIPFYKSERIHEVFGQKTALGYTPLVLVPPARSGNIIHVYHGFDSVISENGKTVGIFSPGIYWRTHFWQVSYIVSKQRIPYHFAVKSCPTKDNVRVDVFVDFLFHVHNTMDFVTKISAENMEELLRSTEAEAVRGRVRSVNSDQVLDLRGVNCDDMLTTLNEVLNPYGITIDRVTIASVHLPREVTERLQNTTTYLSKQKLQQKKQELELLKLSGDQNFQQNQSLRMNELNRVREMGKKARLIIQQEIDAIQERLTADVKRVEDEYDNRTQQIIADRAAEVEGINRMRDKQVAEIRAEGERKASAIRLEAEKYEAAVRSKTALKLAEMRAEIAKIRAETERYAAQRLKERRDYEVKQERIRVISSISSDPNTTICCAGETPNPITTLLCNARATAHLGLKQK